MNKKTILTRTIRIVAFVSLFTDISSEMLYPVMPVYLSAIGFTALWIGILEGFAEGTAGLSKGYFGMLSDKSGKRLPFVQAGYFLSAISKPMLALFTNTLWIFFWRTSDRFGKGIRTAPRDAILSSESSRENKGKVFGYHRSIDTLGAALGPVLALIYLHFYPGNYSELFFIAFAPAILGVVLTFFIKEKQSENTPESKGSRNPFSFFLYWKKSTIEYKRIVIGFLLFVIANSSDMFLLLFAKSRGIGDTHIIGMYIFYNLVYALFAYPMGKFADKFGMKITFVIGLIFFSMTYIGITFSHNLIPFYVSFLVYGLFAASTESITKAWISKIIPVSETGTAIGLYASLASIGALLSSSLSGLIWVSFSASYALLFSAIVSLFVAGYFLVVRTNLNSRQI